MKQLRQIEKDEKHMSNLELKLKDVFSKKMYLNEQFDEMYIHKQFVKLLQEVRNAIVTKFEDEEINEANYSIRLKILLINTELEILKMQMDIIKKETKEQIYMNEKFYKIKTVEPILNQDNVLITKAISFELAEYKNKTFYIYYGVSWKEHNLDMETRNDRDAKNRLKIKNIIIDTGVYIKSTNNSKEEIIDLVNNKNTFNFIDSETGDIYFTQIKECETVEEIKE